MSLSFHQIGPSPHLEMRVPMVWSVSADMLILMGKSVERVNYLKFADIKNAARFGRRCGIKVLEILFFMLFVSVMSVAIAAACGDAVAMANRAFRVFFVGEDDRMCFAGFVEVDVAFFELMEHTT